MLKNSSNTKQKDVGSENELFQSTEASQPQAQATVVIKTEEPQANKEDIAQKLDNANARNVSSDNESIISEPKLENYDLYEVVGDLSVTILNQLSSKPEYHKLSSHNQTKSIFDLEALMAPSAINRTEYNENAEKKTLLKIEVS